MASKNTRPKTPEICPVCGEDVPPRALACPECGADHNSGWREDTGVHDGADIPDEDFDYDDFVKNEFGASGKPAGIKLLWWITAIILLAATIVGWLFAAH